MKRIGQYYKETVLTLPKKALKNVELPPRMGKVEIANNLFAWSVSSKNHSIDCASEAEARFLKVFWDAGLTEIMVPKDEEYLLKILPELERLKAKTDEILESYLTSIFDRQAREQLRHAVFMEITQ
jgi:hypothetical protein